MELTSAAKAGDVEKIRDLLRCGAELNAVDYDGRSAFAMVCLILSFFSCLPINFTCLIIGWFIVALFAVFRLAMKEATRLLSYFSRKVSIKTPRIDGTKHRSMKRWATGAIFETSAICWCKLIFILFLAWKQCRSFFDFTDKALSLSCFHSGRLELTLIKPRPNFVALPSGLKSLAVFLDRYFFCHKKYLYQKISQKISDGYSEPSDNIYIPIYIRTYIYIHILCYVYVHKKRTGVFSKKCEQVYFQHNTWKSVFSLKKTSIVCILTASFAKDSTLFPPPSLPFHSPSCSLAPPDLLS